MFVLRTNTISWQVSRAQLSHSQPEIRETDREKRYKAWRQAGSELRYEKTCSYGQIRFVGPTAASHVHKKNANVGKSRELGRVHVMSV